MVILQFQSGYTETYQSERHCLDALCCRFPGSYLGDWESASPESQRRLVWRYESDSADDPGAKAMAQMIREVTT